MKKNTEADTAELFHLSHIDKVYSLKAISANERCVNEINMCTCQAILCMHVALIKIGTASLLAMLYVKHNNTCTLLFYDIYSVVGFFNE